MNNTPWLLCGAVALGALIAGACGGDDDGNGSNSSTGGSGGSSSGGSSSGGSSSGGSSSGGSSSGGSSSGGSSSGGTAGEAGGAGMAGAGGEGFETREHNVCEDIAPLGTGDENFTISSPEFDNCGEFPVERTCDGKAFGTGSSPALEWSGAPEGTMSFALVFKDISIEADDDPATIGFAYHSVIWDIPASVTGLPANTGGGHLSSEVAGARQWSVRNEYAFFPPCPNPFAFDPSHPAFPGEYVIDSYSFTLYALSVETLTDIPDPEVDDMGTSETEDDRVINYVKTFDDYLRASSDVLAITEYRATSDAKATSFAPPDPVQYPCTATLTSDCLAGPSN